LDAEHPATIFLELTVLTSVEDRIAQTAVEAEEEEDDE
jgi:hypothetical protein